MGAVLKAGQVNVGDVFYIKTDLITDSNLLLLQPDYPKGMQVTVAQVFATGVAVKEIPSKIVRWSYLSREPV